MTILALVLVVCSGLIHATWNLLAKRSGEDGVPFVWLYSVLSTLIYTPVAAIFVLRGAGGDVEKIGALFMIGTGILHAAYFLCLQRGYGSGDLSVVYPLARGTGPLLSSFAATIVFGERLGPLGVGGVFAITAGVFLLAREPGVGRGGKSGRAGVVYGILTGILIAAYTLWDKYAVSDLALAPLLYYWASLFVESALLTPLALRERQEVGRTWREHRAEAIGVAVLSPLAYLLVLTAMVFTPVSRIAPVREVGILIGTVMGGRLLSEGGVERRLFAAGLMVGGIIVLAFG
ncbi:DMT family transporter [Rubrobacter calidifluminis]|uniref:DMT family transporter n=1 Tax=Rubrobacter calidifluminis TaxID=1392640 RepID=UPI002360BDDD|nr:DMT family transporter [Rubrobacter calidifluminis]